MHREREMRRNVNNLRSQLASVKDSSAKRLASEVTRAKRLEASSARQAAEMSVLRTELSSLRKKCASLRASLSGASAPHAKVAFSHSTKVGHNAGGAASREDSATLQKKLNDERSKRIAAAAAVERLRSENGKLAKELSAAGGSGGRNGRRRGAKAGAKGGGAARKAAERKLHAAEARCCELEGALAASRKELVELYEMTAVYENVLKEQELELAGGGASGARSAALAPRPSPPLTRPPAQARTTAAPKAGKRKKAPTQANAKAESAERTVAPSPLMKKDESRIALQMRRLEAELGMDSAKSSQPQPQPQPREPAPEAAVDQEQRRPQQASTASRRPPRARKVTKQSGSVTGVDALQEMLRAEKERTEHLRRGAWPLSLSISLSLARSQPPLPSASPHPLHRPNPQRSSVASG